MELADGITPQDIKLFLTEADEQLQLLDEDIVRLERESDNVKLLQEIFRASHTIKGSSAMIGHQRMSHLAHGMENVLDKVRKGALAVSSFSSRRTPERIGWIKNIKRRIGYRGRKQNGYQYHIGGELEAAMVNVITNPEAASKNGVNQPRITESKAKLEEALSKGRTRLSN